MKTFVWLCYKYQQRKGKQPMFFNLKNTLASLDHLTSWFHSTAVKKKKQT